MVCNLARPSDVFRSPGRSNHAHACTIRVQYCCRWRCSGFSSHCRRNAGLVVVGVAVLEQTSSTMSRNIEQEIADMRQEIQDLETAIARQDPPLAPHTRAIVEAKIATLEHQIAAMMRPPPPPPIAGWRCDLCGEIVTTKERPLAPPERCPRRHSDHITSVEVWAARPLLGLWTR